MRRIFVVVAVITAVLVAVVVVVVAVITAVVVAVVEIAVVVIVLSMRLQQIKSMLVHQLYDSRLLDPPIEYRRRSEFELAKTS